MIESLLKSMVYIRSDSKITTTLDKTEGYYAAKNWNEYVQFQGAYKERVDLLRTEKREVPTVPESDKNMPSILHTWTGRFTNAQPAKNYKTDHSCAFNDSRIQDYERRNAAFQNDIKCQGHLAAAKMIPLMIMDIAFLKSFDVQWEVPPAALAMQEGEASDDDAEEEDMDTSRWDATDPSTVPFMNLYIPTRGKIPTHLVYAATVLDIQDHPSKDAIRYIDQVRRRLEAALEEYRTEDPELVMTRSFTQAEQALYHQWEEAKNERLAKKNKENEPAPADDRAGAATARNQDPAAAAAASSAAAVRSATGSRAAAEGSRAAAAGSRAAAVPAVDGADHDGADGAGGADEAGKGTSQGKNDTDDEVDDIPPLGRGAGRGRGRVKQQARVQPIKAGRLPARRNHVPTDRYRPPSPPTQSSPRIVVAKKKKSVPGSQPEASADLPVVTVQAHAIPISEHTSRIMLGRLELNRRFSKNYMARNPIKKPPLPNMTLSSLWHAVSKIRNNEFIITYYYNVTMRNDEI